VQSPDDGGTDVGGATDRILKMQSRTEAVVENTLAQLENADSVDAGDLAVVVDVQVLCEDCGVQRDVRRFVDGGGCDCVEE